MRASECPHRAGAGAASARAAACEECGQAYQIRWCPTCGHVGCCDSSEGHATAHHEATGHPLIREVSRHGEGFVWCYACGDYLE